MIISKSERAALRDSMHNVLTKLEDGAEKSLFVIILALLSDLEEMERQEQQTSSFRTSNADPSMHSVLRALSSIQTATEQVAGVILSIDTDTADENIDAIVMHNFSTMTEKLQNMTEKVRNLEAALKRSRHFSGTSSVIDSDLLQ